MNDKRTHVEGIYFNSSPSPVFLEGKSIGGHDYVFLEGFLRVPGHFVKIQDPHDDPEAPETFQHAYKMMMEKGESQKKPVHANSNNRRSNVVPVGEDTEESTEEPEEGAEDEKEEEPAPAKTSRTSRKRKSDTSSR